MELTQGQGPSIPSSGRMPHKSESVSLASYQDPGLLGGQRAWEARPSRLVNSRCSMKPTQQGQRSKEKGWHSGEAKNLLSQVAGDAAEPQGPKWGHERPTQALHIQAMNRDTRATEPASGRPRPPGLPTAGDPVHSPRWGL